MLQVVYVLQVHYLEDPRQRGDAAVLVGHVLPPVLPLVQEVGLLHHRGQDVVEAGQPQLRGQALHDVQHLARQVQTDQHGVARPHLQVVRCSGRCTVHSTLHTEVLSEENSVIRLSYYCRPV